MATTNNVGVKNGWSLIAFVAGKHLQRGTFENKDTHEQFESLIVTAPNGNRQFVHFSSNLGVLSNAQIKAMKDQLQVVELNTGGLVLCKQGENTWEDVDL